MSTSILHRANQRFYDILYQVKIILDVLGYILTLYWLIRKIQAILPQISQHLRVFLNFCKINLPWGLGHIIEFFYGEFWLNGLQYEPQIYKIGKKKAVWLGDESLLLFGFFLLQKSIFRIYSIEGHPYLYTQKKTFLISPFRKITTIIKQDVISGLSVTFHWNPLYFLVTRMKNTFREYNEYNNIIRYCRSESILTNLKLPKSREIKFQFVDNTLVISTS